MEGNFTPITAINITSEEDVSTIAEQGGTLQLTAALTPEEPTLPDVEWSTGNPFIATVDQNGLVTAAGDGVVNITAEARDGSGMEDVITLTISGQETITSTEPDIGFIIFPNPSTDGTFRMKGLEHDAQIAVLTMEGQFILKLTGAESGSLLRVPAVPGIYLLRVTTNQYSFTRKIIVR